MRISDWSSDGCSSDLEIGMHVERAGVHIRARTLALARQRIHPLGRGRSAQFLDVIGDERLERLEHGGAHLGKVDRFVELNQRTEEHTSELQSLMRNSYAVLCLTKKITETQEIQ